MTPERDEHGRFKSTDNAAPRVWSPHVEIGKDDARAVLSGGLTETEALQEMGLDPDTWEVTQYRRRSEETAKGTRQHTSIAVRRRPTPVSEMADVQDLKALVDGWETTLPRRSPVRGDAFVVALADWQIGKGEGGGSAASIDRILTAGDSVVERFEELRAIGREPSEIVIIGLGDIVEGCSGWYPGQEFTVDLDQRSQLQVVWRLITALLRKWAPLTSKMTIAPIGGNHGENRNNGRSFTTASDNLDIAAFEIVRDILAERPGFEHVRFQIPEDHEALSTVVDAAGVPIGITHGHLMSGGPNPAGKAHKWWTSQVFGYGPVSQARVLVSGHFHSFQCVTFAREGRTWLQAPAMDGGSAWFESTSGLSAPPGLLTFMAGKGCGPLGVDHIRIL